VDGIAGDDDVVVVLVVDCVDGDDRDDAVDLVAVHCVLLRWW